MPNYAENVIWHIERTGVLTGKSMLFGGIHLRPEATGYGTVYMAKHAIEDKLKKSLDGARCAVSGSGNVAQYATKMLMQLGGKVVTISDSDGVLVFDDGMTSDDFDKIIDVRFIDRFVDWNYIYISHDKIV